MIALNSLLFKHMSFKSQTACISLQLCNGLAHVRLVQTVHEFKAAISLIEQPQLKHCKVLPSTLMFSKDIYNMIQIQWLHMHNTTWLRIPNIVRQL